MNGWNTTPRHSSSGLVWAAKRRDLVVVLPPQLAVDDQELREVVPLGLHLGRALENRRHDAIEQAIVELDAAAS